jgi:hypothetical protein
MTPVLFRKSDGEIVAVFPTLPANDLHMVCYAHVGQHGECSHEWYRTTKSASEPEYASLKRELEAIGYELKVYQRLTHGMKQI